MSSPNISLLAGLVGGYNQAKDSQLHQDLAARASQRDQMLQYLGHLATAPNIPVEHQQWAMQKAAELAQHDITKKLPKVDLGELPPVMRQAPDRQAVTQQPGFQLKPPASPGEVGQASNGTVNALGAGGGGIQMPTPPPRMNPPTSPSAEMLRNVQAPAPQAPMSVPGAPSAPTVNVPPGAMQTIVNPQPPQQIAPGGAIHLTTPQERAQENIDTTQQSINQLQRQYPMKSREDLAYFAQRGEFPKPGKEDAGFTLGPGQKRFDSEGKQIAANEEAKPGAKSGFSVDKGPAGEPIIKDNETGAALTPEQAQANPDAKKLLDSANAAIDKKEKERTDKEDRQFRKQLALMNAREDNSLNRQVTGAATKAAGQAKAMVDVLDTSERYMRSGSFTPRQDLALVIRAVRAMNPGTVRMPQKELDMEIKAGSYPDAIKRAYSTATTGLLPTDQRQDLMNVIREETTQTATSAAENWKQAFAGKQATPTFLKRFTGEGQVQAPKPPPSTNGAASAPNASSALPPQAVAQLQEGHNTTFANGQVWTLRGGQPVQVK